MPWYRNAVVLLWMNTALLVAIISSLGAAAHLFGADLVHLREVRALAVSNMAGTAIDTCKHAALEKKIDVNPFSLIGPDSIRIAIETVRYGSSGPVNPSRSEFVAQYTADPSRFVTGTVLMIDLSVPSGPRIICVYSPFSRSAVVQKDFKSPEWYQRIP
jgi:hypothetical protein